MIENKKTRAIVSAITKLSASLGIKTIAEGIEQEANAKWLEESQCHYGQGYLFDKPLPIEEFEQKYLA